MDPEFRGGLYFPLNIEQERQTLVLSTDTERITLTGIDAKTGADIIQCLNSRPKAAELLSSADNGEQTANFLETLSTEKLVLESQSFYTGAQLADLLHSYFDDWNNALFSRPLWTWLADGRASEAVLDGWLIETYHFIRGANARLSYATSQTSDLRVRRIFAHHYVEEYDHYKFFAESLRRRGFDPDVVEKAGPLVSTVAVINMARRAARDDCLAYAACSGLLESTGCDAARARSFYNAIAAQYDKAGSGFVEPMLRHIDLDEAYEHGEVMADIYRPIARIDSERADRIVECVFLFKEILLLWFDDIQNHYLRHPFSITDALQRNRLTYRR
jgi:hypothetical protein